jgi:PIN domain nuclease of toxin-antitoxin system
MADGDNQLFLSAASGWEIAIKAGLGRLRISDEPRRFVFRHMSINGIDPLPVLLEHALHVYSLPGHHRDPFDRLLVAQSELDKLPVVTADPQVTQYGVEVVW